MKLNYCKPKKINLDYLAKQYTESHHNPDLIETQQTPDLIETQQKPDLIETQQNPGIIGNPQLYNPYLIEKSQLYNPIYRKFFDMNTSNFDNIALNHPYHVQDAKHIIHHKTNEIQEKDVFVKFSPLLDPYRYMIGKYKVTDPRIRTMPRLESTEETVHPKILSRHNASYVDCFFSYLSSVLFNHHGNVHGMDYYGSYLGIQNKFRVCVTDDVEYLRNSDFFNDHVGELFSIEDPNSIMSREFPGGGSRRHRAKLVLDDANEIGLDFEELSDNEGIILDNESTNSTNEIKCSLETIYAKSPRASGSITSKSSADSDLNYSSDEDGEWETESSDSDESDEESDEDEEEIYGFINNFPIQMICMEKCDGTLDELFVRDEITVENGASALFQIIMSLLIYQRVFKFTHNDLHTNNVMYVNTEVEFLYYLYGGNTYKVPTYGRIYKLIDFGRSIYKFQGKVFCSDSFSPAGDAATQYNCEPFLNEERPRLDPNNSFDLSRLGTSIFDFLMDIEDDNKEEYDELQKTIQRWCMDDNGKNVLYKKNGEERYPSFKLYKMIARTVHNHSPEAQLEEPYFKQFVLPKEDVKDTNGVINLDTLPCYA